MTALLRKLKIPEFTTCNLPLATCTPLRTCNLHLSPIGSDKGRQGQIAQSQRKNNYPTPYFLLDPILLAPFTGLSAFSPYFKK